MTRSSSPARVGMISLLLLTAVFAVVGSVLPYDTVGGPALAMLGVVAVGALVITRSAPESDRRAFIGIAAFALLVKIFATFLRFFITDAIWGFSDARRYEEAGLVLSQGLRSGDLSAALTFLSNGPISNFGFGTVNTGFAAGIALTIVGESLLATFILFSFVSFLGSLGFAKAAYVIFPDRKHRFYTWMVFLLPSILFWTSSLGKDALLFGAGGVFTYGVALAMTNRRARSIVFMGIGAVGLLLIRPEIGLLVLFGGLIGLGASSIKNSSSRSTTIVLKILPAMFVMILFIPLAGRLIGLDLLSVDALLEAMEKQASREFLDSSRTERGSTFQTSGVGQPSWLGSAMITVFARPFIWEANSFQLLFQAVETSALLGLIVLKSRTIFSSVLSIRSQPFMLFLVVTMILSVLALSTLGNFGLLSRQRTIIYPMLLFLMVGPGYATSTVNNYAQRVSRLPVISRSPRQVVHRA